MRISDWSSDVCSSDHGKDILHRRLIQTPPIVPQAAAYEPPALDHAHAATHCRYERQPTDGAADRRPDGVLQVRLGRRRRRRVGEMGRAAWWDRVCPYGEIAVGGGSIKKKKN